MSGYKPYPKYKESGVEWLGEGPEHWECLKFRHLFEESSEKIESEIIGEMLSVSGYRGIEIRQYADQNQKRSEENLVGYRVVRKGQLVVNTMWLNYTGLGISEHEGHVSPAYRCYWVNKSLHKPYVHHLLRSALYVIGYTKYLTGIRPNSLQMSRDDLMVFPIVIPSISEQQSIATFLDRETSKLDILIREQKELIILLQEKRQAMISNAVTKGLNPKAKMKDSGVEWLGEVPEHWEVGPIKIWFPTKSGGTPNTAQYSRFYTDEGGFPWIRSTDLNNDFLHSYEIAISDEGVKNSACEMLPKESVLVAMYGGSGTVGKNALLMFDACINQAVCALLPNASFESQFTFRYIQFYRPHWMIGAESSRKDPNISQDQIRNAPILKPPIREQKEILFYLDQETSKLDALIKVAEETIDLMHEHRASLISEAVTGKIDVRKQA